MCGRHQGRGGLDDEPSPNRLTVLAIALRRDAVDFGTIEASTPGGCATGDDTLRRRFDASAFVGKGCGVRIGT